MYVKNVQKLEHPKSPKMPKNRKLKKVKNGKKMKNEKAASGTNIILHSWLCPQLRCREYIKKQEK